MKFAYSIAWGVWLATMCTGCTISADIGDGDVVASDASADDATEAAGPEQLDVYHRPNRTNFGVDVSCADCHGPDGAGGQDTSGMAVGGIRGLSADVLADHAQGDARHPAPTGRTDVKFPNLTPADFVAIADFLSQ